MIIGFTCGIFDLFHPGHVLMLKECKEHCDYLIVAINKGENISPDINPNKRKPVYTIDERLLLMQSCRYVDEIRVYNSEDELLEIMKINKIDIRFLGDDYIRKPVTGNDLNIKLHFINRSHGYSTSNILNKIRGRF